MNLIAIDPGSTIGIATRINGKLNTSATTDAEELFSLLYHNNWDYVICERFAATTISGPGLLTVRLEGGVRAICYVRHVKLILKMPQQRIAFIESAREEMKGQGAMNHEVDALAHLLAFEHHPAAG